MSNTSVKIILLLILLFSFELNAQELKFKRITVNDGLSQYDVSCVLQDSYGFIWVGTYDGLNRFDGIQVENFYSNLVDKNTLSGNRILSLFEDSFKRIWIGTDGDGLCYYDLRSNKFVRLKNEKSYSRVFNIFELNNGTICASTNGGIVNVAEKKNEIYIDTSNVYLKGISIFHMAFGKNNLIYAASTHGLFEIDNEKVRRIEAVPLQYYRELAMDDVGNLWAAPLKGLFVVQKKDEKFIAEEIEIFKEFEILSIVESKDGKLWIGTATNGLYRFDKDTKEILDHFSVKTENTRAIVGNFISDLMLSKENVLWVGSRGGVSYTDLNQPNIKTLNSTEGKDIYSIFIDDESFYYTTKPNGVYRHSIKNNTVSKISDMTIATAKKVDDKIYISDRGGLYNLNRNNQSIEVIDEELSYVFCISKDELGNLYLGRLEGLSIRNDTINDFIENIYEIARPLKGKWFSASYYDKTNNCLWLGSNSSGLFKLHFSPKGELTDVQEFNRSKKGNYFMPSNFIWCFYKDANNKMWIGSGAGLLYQQEDSEKIEVVTNEEVINKSIFSIMGDKFGDLWLGSSLGLLHYKPKTNFAKKYNYQDGLAASSITDAITVDKDGTIYLGTTNGINYFKPEDFNEDDEKFSTVITQLKIYGNTVNLGDTINGRVILRKDIKETNEITLSYKEKYFELDFASPEYINPTKLKYAYQLYPLNKTWIDINNNIRTINFNGIPVGNYILKIRVANTDGMWNDVPRELKINILSPFWETWWFRSILFLALALFILVFSLIRRRRIKELKTAKEKAEESDRLKSAFLANMSHEIRTPMNGILGFTDLLKNPKLSGEDQKRFIEIIKKSGDRLLDTVNDIIDVSKIEAGQVKVVISDINMNNIIDDLFEFFLPEAKKRNIQLIISNQIPYEHANFKSDKDKLNSIITNLIKNAIKFTSEGCIEISCSIKNSEGKDKLEISVKDTGIGIPKNRQKAIFERFVMGDIEDIDVKQGSGLGLTISKAFVKMLGGEIWLESEEGIGSQFYFTIPYETNKNKIPKKTEEDVDNKLSEQKKLKILIVDDDEFVITYLVSIIEEYSKETLIARTGLEAVEACSKNPDVDIILMDIKLPEINGYEATRQIREFNKQVFIVAQTAYALSGDRDKCFQAGCDDYISKPIKKEVLKTIFDKYLTDKQSKF